MMSRILCDKVRVTCDEGEKERPAVLCKMKWPAISCKKLVPKVTSKKYYFASTNPTVIFKQCVQVTKQNVILQKKAGEVEKDEENLKFEKEHAMKLNFSRRQKFVQEYCTRHMS
ncbi:hypothetical protein ACOSQ3_027470 [Xanthoceras sorbifolium]